MQTYTFSVFELDSRNYFLIPSLSLVEFILFDIHNKSFINVKLRKTHLKTHLVISIFVHSLFLFTILHYCNKTKSFVNYSLKNSR